MTGMIPDKPAKTWLIAILATGLLLQIWFFLRGWLGDDQINLLRIGLDFAHHHELRPIAKGMSGSGHIPGGLLQLIVGLPLMAVPHFKAPNVLVGLSHLAAALVLLSVLRRAMGDRFAALFFGLYWLSPWRLYHVGFLWEPSLLYLPAALHLWACWRSRGQRSWPAAFVLGLILTTTPQVHASFLVLWILTAILAARRLVHLHPLALALGALAGGLTLIPTLVAALQGTLPAVAPTDGFVGRGLVHVYPVLKSALYWLRFIALDAGKLIERTVFFSSEGSALAVVLRIVPPVLAGSSAILVAVLLFRLVRDWRARRLPEDSEARWLLSYAGLAFVAMLASAALSPVTIQSWHVIIILHAACITGAYVALRAWPRMRWAIIALIALRVPLAFVIGMGHEHYRAESRTDVPASVIEIVPQR